MDIKNAVVVLVKIITLLHILASASILILTPLTIYFEGGYYKSDIANLIVDAIYMFLLVFIFFNTNKLVDYFETKIKQP